MVDEKGLRWTVPSFPTWTSSDAATTRSRSTRYDIEKDESSMYGLAIAFGKFVKYP